MRYLVTGNQMKQIDQNAIESIGIPSMVLMERAALAVAKEIMKRSCNTDQILIACGTGNNGADGIAVARMLYLKEYCVTLVFKKLGDHGTDEWQKQLEIAENLGIPMLDMTDLTSYECDILVDAVFGVGLSRNLEGSMYEFIKLLSLLKANKVFAVDIPSGISSEFGSIMGIAIKADATITFGYEKLGTALYPGKEYSGEVMVRDIGFPTQSFQSKEEAAFTYDFTDLKRLPKRYAYGNKGTFGKVLIVAGSKNMSGAAYLSALAAYRTGAGMVKILTAEENRTILQQLLPEAILESYDTDWINASPDESADWIRSVCKWADVVVIGPGMGQAPYVDHMVNVVLSTLCVPAVIDADAINSIARNPRVTELLKANMIITPHLGEMSRLMKCQIGNIQDSLIETARQYSRLNDVICVLKDAVTIVTGDQGQIYVNSSGNSGMAKAGSGDVLTGVIAGLLALGMKEYEAATMGVYIHGLAGDQLKIRKGSHGMLAHEIAHHAGLVMRDNLVEESM